jgi:hypothetical protein
MRRKEEKRFPTKIPHLWVIGSCVDGTNLINFAKKKNCSVFFNNRFRFFCSIKFADFKNGVKSQSFDLKTFFLKRKCLHSKMKSNYSFKWKRSSSGWFNLPTFSLNSINYVFSCTITNQTWWIGADWKSLSVFVWCLMKKNVKIEKEK